MQCFNHQAILSKRHHFVFLDRFFLQGRTLRDFVVQANAVLAAQQRQEAATYGTYLHTQS